MILKGTSNLPVVYSRIYLIFFKDRHQWLGREFRCSLSLSMDTLFPKAMKYIIYHLIAND